MAFFKNIIADAKGEALHGNFAAMKERSVPGMDAEPIGQFSESGVQRPGLPETDLGKDGAVDLEMTVSHVSTDTGSVARHITNPSGASDTDQRVHGNDQGTIETQGKGAMSIEEHGLVDDSAMSLNDLTSIVLNSVDSRLSVPVTSDNNDNHLPVAVSDGEYPGPEEPHGEKSVNYSVDHDSPVTIDESRRQVLIPDDITGRPFRNRSQDFNSKKNSVIAPLSGDITDTGDMGTDFRPLNKMPGDLQDTTSFPEQIISEAAGNTIVNQKSETPTLKAVLEPVEIRSELNRLSNSSEAQSRSVKDSFRTDERKKTMHRNESETKITKTAPRVHIGQVDVVVQAETRNVNFNNQRMSRADQSVSGARRYLRGV